MREFKFRAWVDSYSNWHMTNKISIGSDGVFFHAGQSNITNKDWVLMQYTGLKDKNGTEIYEGDIIELGTKERFYVAWHDYKQEFTFRGYGGGYYPNTYRGATRDDQYGWKVIGNIYENKELLD